MSLPDNLYFLPLELIIVIDELFHSVLHVSTSLLYSFTFNFLVCESWKVWISVRKKTSFFSITQLLRNTQVGWEVIFSALNSIWLIFSSAVSSLLLNQSLNLKSITFFISRGCNCFSNLPYKCNVFFLFSSIHLLTCTYLLSLLKKFTYIKFLSVYYLFVFSWR